VLKEGKAGEIFFKRPEMKFRRTRGEGSSLSFILPANGPCHEEAGGNGKAGAVESPIPQFVK